ncbi:hypothetical protein GCM10010918_26750 [Paenibacillus radicis (ex Gao et al. 2016)]|uniref:Uncharacterized protein n=1 Tax=Paenibacillus radicis (ex Gao et al. 2016) TaxID=1737354 RepID=A0A917M196_9BACL|nr:hypothetical protein GCM10010918_26750 [Paenibacillus radicis (ex Gao et al. 2016)]
MINTVIYNLYIPATEGGVFDDLIIIDDMAIARILIHNKKYGLTAAFDFFSSMFTSTCSIEKI